MPKSLAIGLNYIAFFLLTFSLLFGYMSRETVYANPHGNYVNGSSACAFCHTTHGALGPKLVNKTSEKALCYSCHDGTASQLNILSEFGESPLGTSSKASHHPVPENTQACSTCHDPHEDSQISPRILSVGSEEVSGRNAVCEACHGATSTIVGGDMVTSVTGTAHDSLLTNPVSGTQIKCVRCHQPHGSPFKPLLEEEITDQSGQKHTVTGNDNSLCFGCHRDGTRNYKGMSQYNSSKHGSVTVSTVAKTSYGGTSYGSGQCLNCHEPHGKTGFSKYTRAENNKLCVNCHDDATVTRSEQYSYRGIDTYNATPHATAAPPAGLNSTYNSSSQGFTVWQSLGSQTPQSPGELVLFGNDLSSIDSTWSVTDLARDEGTTNTQMYRFKITEPINSIATLRVKWVGYGEPTINHPVKFMIWNYTLNSGGGGWEEVDSRDQGSDAEIIIERSPAASYLNSKGEVFILASALHDGTGPVIIGRTETANSTTSITIGLNTNEYAKTVFEYGQDTTYGPTLADNEFKTQTSFTLNSLSKHIIYHYRFITEDALGNKSTSPDYTFELSDPPATPILIAQSDINTEDSVPLVTFTWNTVDDPNGDPVEYQVQVSTSNSFSTLVKQSSWLAETGSTQSWSVGLYSGSTYYWRVVARDKNHPLMMMPSAYDSFWIATSCPILYTWDGNKYNFVSDVMGLGTLGLPIGKGQYRYPPSVEQTKIEEQLLQAKDGRYRMIIKNELDEIEFIDRLRLKVVDHSEGTETFINDFTRAALPLDPVQIFTVDDLRPVKQATYINNPLYKGKSVKKDITSLVSSIDGKYAPASLFDDNQYILDLGNLKNAKEIKLVVSGWSKFASNGERTAWLKSKAPKAERAMDVMGPDGQWVEVMNDLPYIPGLTKSAVYDLTGKFPKDVKQYKIRIRGLPRTYFDYFAVDTSKTEPVSVKELAPVKANLKYFGRSLFEEKPQPQFDFYEIVNSRRIYHEGNFTRYGDVLPLLQKAEDMFVVMDTGDGIELEFKAPPLKPGMKRDYIFYADGYFQEITGKVEPMPFHAMSNYPYGEDEQYPQDKAHQDYLKTWNTRVHPVQESEIETDSSWWFKFKQWLEKVFDWFKLSLKAETKPVQQAKATAEGLLGKPSAPHYSLNTNYIELQVTGTSFSGGDGNCTNCHAVHGNSGTTKQLKSNGPNLCFGNGLGCHSNGENSANGINIRNKFTLGSEPTARHGVEPAEQIANSTKVDCYNCHNPHLNSALMKTVNPDNRYTVSSQWSDAPGILDYFDSSGNLYVMAKAKHDGTPPEITNVNATVNNAVYGVSWTWYTSEFSTQQVEWGTSVGNYVYTEGTSAIVGYNLPVYHGLSIEGLQVGVDYHYRVRAEDAVGNVSYSPDRVFKLSSPPGSPGNLRHLPTILSSGNHTETVRLEWDVAVDPDGDDLQYYVQGLGTSSGWLPVGQTYWETSVSNYGSVTFSWKVKARDVYGSEGSFSVTDSFTHVGDAEPAPSCPIVYTWNGQKFEFLTDVTDSTVGLQIAPGKFAGVRPDAKVVIPAGKLEAKNGFYELSIKNERDEVDFHDTLVLQAVDHPEGTLIALNNLVRNKEPYKLYSYSSQLKPVRKATYVNNPTYSGGKVSAPKDISSLVSAVDSKHAIGSLFDDNQFTFDLGQLKGAKEIKMVIVGWNEFANAKERKLRVNKAKAGVKMAPRLLEILQPDGSWKRVEVKQLPGHTKTTVLDLTGKFPKGTKKFVVRLRGMYRPHFDFIGVDTTPQASLKTTTLKLVDANLSYKGLALSRTYPSPDYNYDQILDKKLQHEGKFTRFGDVTELLTTVDDRLVVMDSGDELLVRFEALPPTAPGMVRSFVITPWDYYKELELAEVEPMPFRGMDLTKLPDSFGDYPKHLEDYIKEWNTREHRLTQTLWDKIVEILKSWWQRVKDLFIGDDERATKIHRLGRYNWASGHTPDASHYSLNTNYIGVGIGTDTGFNLYLPNSLGSQAWESAAQMPTFDSPGTLAEAGDLSNSSTKDTNHWASDLAVAEGAYNYHMFKFKVAEQLTSINRLAVEWIGHGEPTPDHETAVYIWNFATSSWEVLGLGQHKNDTRMTFFKTRDNSAFCNKCHDNSPPSGVLMGLVPPANIASYSTTGYHGDFKGTKGHLDTSYVPASGRLACDDCHDPHGSSNAYHLRESINGKSGISVFQTNGVGAKSFCEACHVGDIINDWHKSCIDCHNATLEPNHGDFPPWFSTSIISNCFRCHGHNKSWYNTTSCNDCHGGGVDHNYSKTF